MRSKSLIINALRLTALTFALGTLAFAADGVGTSGGGFKYYYTSGAYYRNVKNFIAQTIELAPASDFQALEQKYKTTIDWKRFAAIVKKAGAQPEANRSRANPDGYAEPLIMDYDVATQSITALQPFFELFHKPSLNAEETVELERLIIHETSHLFGLGIANDDKVSYRFSKDLLKIVNRYWYRCGTEKISICESAAPFLDNDSTKPREIREIHLTLAEVYGKRVVAPFVCQLRMDSWRRNANLSGWSEIGEGQQRVISDAKGMTAKFDVSRLQPGDALVLSAWCWTGKREAVRLRSILTDESGNPLSSSSPLEKEHMITEGTIMLKADLLKSDSGTWGGFSMPKSDEL